MALGWAFVKISSSTEELGVLMTGLPTDLLSAAFIMILRADALYVPDNGKGNGPSIDGYLMVTSLREGRCSPWSLSK